MATDLLTFYVDVNGVDENGFVGSTLAAATNPLEAQINRPTEGLIVRAVDSDGNTCWATVREVRPTGWLRLELDETTWQDKPIVRIDPPYSSVHSSWSAWSLAELIRVA